jgi:hypothetical protein
MSTRSRAVPWFLERPPYYISERKLGPGGFGEVTVWRDWSWDAKTWFKGDGSCFAHGLYFADNWPPPDVLERHPILRVMFAEREAQARAAGERFLGQLISGNPNAARA